MRWPLWRHAAYGAILAALLAAMPLEYGHKIIAFGIVVVATMLIVLDDKKRHGMFVSGYQRGRTGWVLLANAVAFLAALAAMNAWIADAASPPLNDPLYWMLVGGIFAISTALSVVWQRVYQADLRKGRK